MTGVKSLEEIRMDESVSPGCFTKDHKYFYTEFLAFARQYPEMKVSLYVPCNDLSLFAKKECFSIVCELLTLCESGRLTLMGIMPRPRLLDYLREIRDGQNAPILFQEKHSGPLRIFTRAWHERLWTSNFR